MFTKSDDGKSNSDFDFRESGIWCELLMKGPVKTTPELQAVKSPAVFRVKD